MLEKINELSTADICDEHGDKCAIAKPVLRLYGGKNCCAGRITTIKLKITVFSFQKLVLKKIKHDFQIFGSRDLPKWFLVEPLRSIKQL